MTLQVVQQEQEQKQYTVQLLSTKELYDKYWGACIPLFQECIDRETNTFKSKSELINLFNQNDIDISKPIVFTCGSGMTACVLGMAYSLISDKNAVIYDGSWSEYGKK